MSYRTEFPGFDDPQSCERLLARGSWEDTSWRNDQCPSFQCDVATIYVGWKDASKEDLEPGPHQRFSVQYEGEDRGAFGTLDEALEALLPGWAADYPIITAEDLERL